MHTLQIIDVTLATCLRQSPSPREAIALAERLAHDGELDVLDVGDLPTSPERLACIRQIARETEDVAIACRVPMHQPSIDAAWTAIREAERPVLQLVASLATEQRHANHHTVVLALVQATVTYARARCPVTLLLQNATQNDPGWLIQVTETAMAAGAETLLLADTAGLAHPQEYGALFGLVRARARGSARIMLGAHTHNRLGMATANTIAAIKAGARAITVEDGPDGTGDHPRRTEIERILLACPDGFGQLFLSL